jgi:hypothetical protein
LTRTCRIVYPMGSICQLELIMLINYYYFLFRFYLLLGRQMARIDSYLYRKQKTYLDLYRERKDK